MEQKYQKKITVVEEIFNEIRAYSRDTGIPMARVVTKMWKKYKETAEYAKTVLLLSEDKED